MTTKTQIPSAAQVRALEEIRYLGGKIRPRQWTYCAPTGRGLNATTNTVHSLMRRGWLERRGEGDRVSYIVSVEGVNALQAFAGIERLRLST